MKTQMKIQLLGVFCHVFVGAAQAQPAFQNLGFEFATTVPVPGDPYGRVEFTPAFPGWIAYIGGVQQNLALYNNQFLDSSGVGLVDRNSTFGGVIGGNYTAFLQAGVALGGPDIADAALAQTGLVPEFAESLLFRAQHGGLFGSGPGPLLVTLGGQPLDLIPLGTGANFTLYGADIHAWSGQTAELRFTAVATDPHRDNNNWFLDSISFSAVPVPEPSSWALLALGALSAAICGLRRGRSRRRESCSPSP